MRARRDSTLRHTNAEPPTVQTSASGTSARSHGRGRCRRKASSVVVAVVDGGSHTVAAAGGNSGRPPHFTGDGDSDGPGGSATSADSGTAGREVGSSAPARLKKSSAM